jgi:hypothetical protein
LSGALGGVRPVFDGRKNVYAARALPLLADAGEFILDYFDDEDPIAKK